MADPIDQSNWLVKATQWIFNGMISPLIWLLEEPRKREAWYAMNAANIVSVLRGLCSLPVIYGLWTAKEGTLLQIYTVAFVLLAASDGVDGALCRRLKIHSKFGALIDAFADKVLVIGAIVALCQNYSSFFFTLATGMLITVELGNVFVGYLASHLVNVKKQQDGHTNWGKWKFGLELLLVSFGLISLNWPGLTSTMYVASILVFPFAFGLAVMSLRSYIRKYTEYKAQLLLEAS